jgi:thioredoxin 1
MFESLLYIVLAIVGFFVFIQIFFFIQGLLKKGKIIEDFGGELGKKVKSGRKLLLYFYSPGCSACKTMTPVVEKMGQTNKDVHKIDLSRDMKLARIFGVMGTPATVLVENSKIKKYVLGARPESYLMNLIGK